MNIDYNKIVQALVEQLKINIDSISLKEFTDEYISFVESNRSLKTLEGVKLVCKKLLGFFPAVKPVNTIQIKDVENLLDALKKKAPKGVYNYNRTLRAMWNKAKEWNYVRENPFERVKLPKRQLSKPSYVTEEQLDKIVMFIDSQVIKDAVITAFYSGCRLGEIVNLT